MCANRAAAGERDRPLRGGDDIGRLLQLAGPRLRLHRVAPQQSIDEIGLIVTHIDDDGFLRFTGVGGWDPQILVGQRVTVATRDGEVPGVVGRKPIHLLKDDERKRAAEMKDLHIDIGAKDGDEAKGLVRIGDVAVIAADPVELPNDRFIARAMDNRLGCFVAYEAARLVAEAGGAAGDVVAVAAVQEEITFAGARTFAHAVRPDVAIVVDVTHATDAPGIDERENGTHPLGSGPVKPIASSTSWAGISRSVPSTGWNDASTSISRRARTPPWSSPRNSCVDTA